ncbi:peptidoglycan DD-metalloendopeptidase family protein [Ammoniphilus sp. 3BR4]|uniref:peptidoglycan DD-metalloendopeptidase family protein n=1 Tax=Ammoniphilus sp. 3BR4 TaxID=3158265 RepID=UPI003465D351
MANNGSVSSGRWVQGGIALAKLGPIGIVILLLLMVPFILAPMMFFFQREPGTVGIVGGTISEFGAHEIPANFIPIYKAAEAQYGVPWNLLAAHHRVETTFSTNVSVSSAGAVGAMQFMPATWAGWKYPHTPLGKITIPIDISDPSVIAKGGGYGVDGDGDGKADPYNPVDAIYSAAKYLAANGAAEGRIREAIYAYNHSEDYVMEVMSYAERYVKVPQVVQMDAGNGLVNPVPTGYRVSSDFGFRIHPTLKNEEKHTGIDLAAPEGEPAVSITTGKVSYAGWRGGYGNTVIVDYGNGVQALYGHLSKIAVEPGTTVKAGQLVGFIGSTGRSTGPHLHFEIRKDGKPIDPEQFIKL